MAMSYGSVNLGYSYHGYIKTGNMGGISDLGTWGYSLHGLMGYYYIRSMGGIHYMD